MFPLGLTFVLGKKYPTIRKLKFLCRYFAVTAPITYSQHKDKHGRVYAFIILCWLASIAIGKD